LQFLQNIVECLEPVFRFFFDHPFNNGGKGWRYIGALLDEGERRIIDVLQRHRESSIPRKWRSSGKSMPTSNAKRVNIATVVKCLSLCLFGTHV
jgi:hypothetical protein